MADQGTNNILFIRDVNRLFYDVAMDHRFERLDLRDLNAGGAFELQRIRDPWLTKRLKWISLSTWTLAQILTEECYRSETLRNAAKTNVRARRWFVRDWRSSYYYPDVGLIVLDLWSGDVGKHDD
ncbi:hypothetical protein PC9H_000053 [Pleurotus ostreatus]|uniref:Uncharacterized protein n=1 Tax=Pleurotus ostreatus TaxID=5322 RepID=A0A8H7DW97_PLEOS|nr:uncharacterized protein PC9H_000053 [Pleurotus ostreatus]KAF7439717.1 hypothetical protein PC9H_000053 [Pleurotus ostreatus]